MIDQTVHEAVEAVCNEDGMDDAYKNALETLIENAMFDNSDTSDIYDLLEQIQVTERTDED